MTCNQNGSVQIPYPLFSSDSQRYKEDISSEQKEALYGVLRVHFHAKIGPEIRRELQNSKSRDEETATPKDGMDDDLRSVTSDVIDANYQELFG